MRENRAATMLGDCWIQMWCWVDEDQDEWEDGWEGVVGDECVVGKLFQFVGNLGFVF